MRFPPQKKAKNGQYPHLQQCSSSGPPPWVPTIKKTPGSARLWCSLKNLLAKENNADREAHLQLCHGGRNAAGNKILSRGQGCMRHAFWMIVRTGHPFLPPTSHPPPPQTPSGGADPPATTPLSFRFVEQVAIIKDFCFGPHTEALVPKGLVGGRTGILR